MLNFFFSVYFLMPLERGIFFTWNLNDPCFDWKGPCFGGLTFKNRGQLGSTWNPKANHL